MSSTKTKNYCFTDFHDHDWEKTFNESDSIQYIGWGQETCPTTGKSHQQGWLQFTQRVTWATAKKRLPTTTSVYQCRGSPKANEQYCRKEGDFKSFGQFVLQGQRTDVKEVDAMIQEGKSIEDIGDVYMGIYCRYYNSLSRRICAVDKRNSTEFRHVSTEVYSGETGTGKTRCAVEQCGWMIHADQLQWWDGYSGESTIIIDEYANQIKITQLMGILDGYQLRLPVKGGSPMHAGPG